MDVTASQIGGPLLLFLLMMIVGMELTVADFRRVLAAPLAVVGGTLGQWILLPLMTWCVVVLYDLPPVFGAGAVLVAVSPGAGMSNIMVALGRANTALSVTLTATASVFAVVTLPFISSAAMGLFLDDARGVEVPIAALVAQLLVSLLLPITSGMLLRHHRPETAARLGPWLQRLMIVVLVLVVTVGLATAPEEQLAFEGGGRALLAAATWSLLAGAIGWAVGWGLRVDERDRFTLAIEFAARNVAVSTIVAMSGLGRIDLTFFSGLYVATGYPMVVLAVFVRRRFIQGP